ncbi:MAG: hypothetical protein QM572_12665, partial [Nocardioides sp.]|uniref:hypothetical protein n=1 Tax=Nocardioides sp. TaxID=35761 RepID=UPI0039E3C2B2
GEVDPADASLPLDEAVAVVDAPAETAPTTEAGTEVAAAAEAAATTEAEVARATEAEPATRAEPHTETETEAEPGAQPEAAAPRRRRGLRLVLRLVVAAVVLTLMAGTGWFLARGPLARTASDTPVSEPTTAPAQPSVEVAPRQSDYAAVLSAVTASTDLASLSAAADAATTLGQDFSTLRGATDAGQELINAETAALQALSALDAITEANASAQFPAVMATIRSAADAVAKARKGVPGSDPTTDTAPTVTTVARVVGPLALTGLTTQLTKLVDQAASSTKTAGLREVAADAFQLRVTTEDTAAVLDEDTDLGKRAALLEAATQSIVSMKTIDADHLDQWDTTGPALTRQLSELGEDTGPVEQIGQLISTATLLMKTWTELHNAPDKTALASYRTSVLKVSKSWTAAWADVPTVTADDSPSSSLTSGFYKASQALVKIAKKMDALKVPDNSPKALEQAQESLETLAKRARAAAVAGHDLALAASTCPSECTLGETAQWAVYQTALAKVGDGKAVMRAWQAAYADAVAAAVDLKTVEAQRPDV